MTEQAARSSLERIRTLCLSIVATGVVCAGLYCLSAALVPFVIAAFFHFSLAPLVDWQRCKWKFPGWLAVSTTGLVGLILLAAFWVLIAVSATQIAGSLGAYQDKLLNMAETGISYLPVEEMGISPQTVRTALVNAPAELVGDTMPGNAGALARLVGQGALVALFLLFMLAGKAATVARAPEFLHKVENSIQRYVLLKVALSAATGLLTWLILTVLGVELALVFGVMAFLLNFIPNIGSVLAALLPVPVLLQNGYSPTTIVLALALPSTVQFVLGNIVEPKLFGKSLGIHPVVVMLTLVLFGLLWGIAGMFLATPLTAVIKIMLDQHVYTKPIARILEGDLSAFGGHQAGTTTA